MQVRSLLLILSVLLVLVLFPSAAFAAPPRPGIVALTQPDGSTFRARAWGDERAHGMETLDGYTIVLDSQSRYWVYAVRSSTGTLTPARGPQGNLVVGRSSPAALPKFARPAAPARAAVPQRVTGKTNVGTQKVLIILAEFSDQPHIGTDATFWNNEYFGATNSVKSFYAQASFNQLNLVPAAETYGTANDGVVGWVTLPGTYASETSSNQFVRDAIVAAAPYVDFSTFDTNNDGYISVDELHIVVVVAGYEASYVIYTSCGNEIWAYESALSDSIAPTLNGKIIEASSHNGGFTTFGEWHCDAGDGFSYPGHPATFGIPTHEFGHDLGLPDLYDTSGATNGIGDWSIMSTGVWNSAGGYAGSSPAYDDAWSRWYEGWLTPVQYSISTPVLQLNVPAIETSPTVIQLLDNPNGVDWVFGSHSGTGEYFLAENRQKTGYDAGLPGCGLLIWHIDESVTSTNSANANANHRLVDLEQADGLRELNTVGGDSGDAGDPFPGTTGNRRFTSISNPNSYLYSGSPSGVTITNISNCSATMTLSIGDWFFFPFIGKQTP